MPAPQKDSDASTRSRGSERRRDIQLVVLDLVAAHGIEGVTIDAIASAAKASKATLYRRWPTKSDLIREAIQMSFGGERPHDPGDLGSLRTELRAVLEGAANMLRENRRLIIALTDGAQRDPVVFSLMRQETRENPRDATQRPLLRAIARGEIGPDTNIDLVSEVALPILHERATWNEPIDDRFVDHLLDDILMPLTERSGRTAR
jgi:AcrR family transcriptional regulator